MNEKISSTALGLEFDKFLTEAVKNKATDIHLSVANPPYMRIEGDLAPFSDATIITPEFIQSFVDYLLLDGQKEILTKEREVIFGYTAKDGIRFKVHAFYQSNQISISMKIVTQNVVLPKELGLSENALKLFSSTKGLLLVAGPLDSGKSTTIDSIVQSINETRSDNIVIIENPIEHIFVDNKSIINQREVGKDVHSYSQALDSILKEDVNVIVIPDLEEAGIVSRVLDIAESNRLVIAGINSEGSIQTIGKIIGMFPKNVRDQIQRQLGDTLVGVITQLLVPQLGGGRIMVEELLLPTQSIKSVIKDGDTKQIETIIQTSRQEGMISLDQSLISLQKEGKISSETVQEFIRDKENISSKDNQNGTI